MFKPRNDNPDIIDAFDDYQEKIGIIKKAKSSKKEWEATIFTRSNLQRVFSSQDQAKRFIEGNY